MRGPFQTTPPADGLAFIATDGGGGGDRFTKSHEGLWFTPVVMDACPDTACEQGGQ